MDQQLKVVTIFGTRPEAIKMAPVIQQLQRFPEQISVRVCVTGQHREMLDQTLAQFQISPDIDLNLMQANQTPTQLAARTLVALEPVLNDLEPDIVLVQGDTTTVMATSIVAHHHRIKIGHIEAGLRTYNHFHPFPEEMNRVVTDHISDLHFAPTSTARGNLIREGIDAGHIFVTGNTVTDALQWITQQSPSQGVDGLIDKVDSNGGGKQLILITAHRRESFGKPIKDLCTALISLAEREDVQLIYTVHRNPNIWEPVHQWLGNHPRITLLPPLDYIALVHLMKRCRLILTDSGGIQEEAPSLGIPVLVLRETTERPEAVQAGVAKIVGTNPERILSNVECLLDSPEAYAAMAHKVNPYGDGKAALRIVDVLLTGQCQEFAPGISP